MQELSKRSLFIVFLHAEIVQLSLHLLHAQPSASSSQRSICGRSICLQQLDACPDRRVVLFIEQCLKAPVLQSCYYINVVYSDVVNVPNAGSSYSISRSHCTTDISQIEIVDQRLCKRRHYSAQKVHAGLCRIKSIAVFCFQCQKVIVLFVVTKNCVI